MSKKKKNNEEKTFTGVMMADDLRLWLSETAKKENRSITGQIIYFLNKARANTISGDQ